jgi:hypothetical protein
MAIDGDRAKGPYLPTFSEMSVFDMLDRFPLEALTGMLDGCYGPPSELEVLPSVDPPSPRREALPSPPARDPRLRRRAARVGAPRRAVRGLKLGDVCPMDLLREIMVSTGVEHPVQAMQLVRRTRCVSLELMLQRRTGVCRTDGGAVVVRLLRTEFPEMMARGWPKRAPRGPCASV